MHTPFTIGHSSHDWESFLALLRQHGIPLVADVRSRPVSMRFPHFSQPELEANLRVAGIGYLFLGEELGGRPDDPQAYRVDGLVDYRQRRKSHAFQQGLERVEAELEKNSLALLCAEEDPIECHRFLMICPELVALGLEPQHIRKHGSLEAQRAAEDRLLEANGFGDVASGSLFAPVAGKDRASALEDAYKAQAEKCAFRAGPQTVEY